MAKKPKVNKTQAVRDYLAAHPGALSSEIAAALNEQGIKITPGYAANIKVTLSKTQAISETVKKLAADETIATTAVEKPANSGNTITLEQVKKVAHAIHALGGFHRLEEVLDVIKDLGGVKRFRELAEAMSVGSADEVPF